MSKLIVPSYLKGKIEDKKEQNKQPALDKVPKAVGWRITVLPHKGIDKTKGGLLLTDKAIEEQQLTTNVGLILNMGPDAYSDKTKFPNGPWCKKEIGWFSQDTLDLESK